MQKFPSISIYFKNYKIGKINNYYRVRALVIRNQIRTGNIFYDAVDNPSSVRNVVRRYYVGNNEESLM